jgi:hypothetical protein
MAQYEVTTNALFDAGERFGKLSIQLDGMNDRLMAVLAQWPDGVPELRRRLSGECSAVGETVFSIRAAGRTLKEVANVYAHAERTAFSGSFPKKAAVSTMVPPPMRKPSGVMLFGDLLMPDWLYTSVLKYEQLRGEHTDI